MIITSEIVISGFVSKIINDFVDILEIPIKNVIKNADKNRKTKNQSIETRIYQVTIDSIKEFTKRDYRDEDVLYDATESILKGFIKNKDDKVEAVRAGVKMLVSQITSDTCEDFLGVLCYEICKEKNRDLAIEVIILQQNQMNGYVQEGFERSFLNNEEVNQKLDFLIEELINKKAQEERYVSKVPIINRADEYAQKWNENVFLNDFNKRDKNAGVNIKLKDIYLEEHLPHYVWKTNDEPLNDLKELLSEYTVGNDDKKMLLVLGQAGIGKSTLITWMMANLKKRKEDILVYQFASDLDSIDWQSKNVLDGIFSAIGLGGNELEDKVLILDGFDEIHASNGKEKILNQIYHSLKEMNYLKQISLIITCRKNYIDELKKVRCDHITLQTWDDEQIISFCGVYGGVSKRSILQNTLDMMLGNKKVFGIPLILYMALALDISIERNASLVDIYDKIFAVNGGGIYDRCINDLSYGKEHRISEVKQQIHQVSQRIAFWIFESNSAKAIIPRMEFRKICDIVMKESKENTEDIQSDALIGNYFEPIRHCEGIGTDELQFAHRSIYEYFVAIYFFESLCKLKFKEDIAGKLGILLKHGYLSAQMLEFMKYKFDNIQNYDLAKVSKEIFQMMLQDGMTFHIGISCKNAVECELNIFANMLKIVHLWNRKLGKVDDKILSYLQCSHPYSLNLAGIILDGADLAGAKLDLTDLKEADLSGADLCRADLSEADLQGANLCGADLSRANLFMTNFNEANLCGADLQRADLIITRLIGANLSGIDLGGADLKLTRFDEEQIDLLHEKYDLSGSMVYFSETEEIISYEDYCIIKQKQ